MSPSIAGSGSAHIIPRAPASAVSLAGTIYSFVVPWQAFGSGILLGIPAKAKARSGATPATTRPVSGDLTPLGSRSGGFALGR